METQLYRYNIGKNYLFNVFMNLNLTSGLWMIYLAFRGFSLIELGILEGCYHITALVMEIPTGIIADIWGRKTSRLLGRVVWSFSLVLMFFSTGMLFQALGFCLCALGNTMESGAGDALVYDSMLLDGNAGEYSKVSGINEFLYEASSILAYLIGGMLALYDWAWVFGLSFVFAMLAIAVGTTLKEPKIIHKSSVKTNALHMMVTQITDSVAVMKKVPRVAFVLISSELLFSFIVSMFFYLQVHWKDGGMNEFEIMVVFAIHSALSGLGALLAHHIRRRYTDYRIMVIIPLMLILFMGGIALTVWQPHFYIAIGTFVGLFSVIVSNYVNKLIPSAQRATILSFQSMAFSVFMIALFPLIGVVGTSFGLDAVFLAMAIVAGALYVPYAFVVHKLSASHAHGTLDTESECV